MSFIEEMKDKRSERQGKTSFIEGMKDKRNENQRGNVVHRGDERQKK